MTEVSLFAFLVAIIMSTRIIAMCVAMNEPIDTEHRVSYYLVECFADTLQFFNYTYWFVTEHTKAASLQK